MKVLGHFQYDDPEIETQCEEAASQIREAGKEMVSGIVIIGRHLIQVKDILPHGQFGPWISTQFGWTHQTANNYMNAARVVEEFQGALELEAETLYLLTSKIPDEVKESIVGNRLSYDEARELLTERAVESWVNDVSLLIKSDPGAALHEIEQALTRPAYHEAAKELLSANVETFARLSGMNQAEILAEHAIGALERYKGSAKTHAMYLEETDDNAALYVWSEQDGIGIPKLVAEMPVSADPVQMAHRSLVLRTLVEKLKPDTVDKRVIQ